MTADIFAFIGEEFPIRNYVVNNTTINNPIISCKYQNITHFHAFCHDQLATSPIIASLLVFYSKNVV